MQNQSTTRHTYPALAWPKLISYPYCTQNSQNSIEFWLFWVQEGLTDCRSVYESCRPRKPIKSHRQSRLVWIFGSRTLYIPNTYSNISSESCLSVEMKNYLSVLIVLRNEDIVGISTITRNQYNSPGNMFSHYLCLNLIYLQYHYSVLTGKVYFYRPTSS